METKKQIRKKYLDIRTNCDCRILKVQNEYITKLILESEYYKNATRIFTYVSYRNEVETHEIIQKAICDGKEVYVPKVEGSMMYFYPIKSLTELEKGAYGIEEPPVSKSEVPDKGDLMLVPGAAFDKNGYRIGYGGGFYDRYLSAHRNYVTIGLAYDFQITDELPTEAYDQPVDQVIYPEINNE